MYFVHLFSTESTHFHSWFRTGFGTASASRPCSRGKLVEGLAPSTATVNRRVEELAVEVAVSAQKKNSEKWMVAIGEPWWKWICCSNLVPCLVKPAKNGWVLVGFLKNGRSSHDETHQNCRFFLESWRQRKNIFSRYIHLLRRTNEPQSLWHRYWSARYQ